MIRHQFGQVEFASEHWFRLAATTLASVTRAAGPGHARQAPAGASPALDLVTISDRLASLILVLREGPIKQALDHSRPPARQTELVAVANRSTGGSSAVPPTAWNRARSQWTSEDPATDSSSHVVSACASPAATSTGAVIEELFSDGLLNVMAAPEFAQTEKLARLRGPPEPRLPRQPDAGVVGTGGVRVFIGTENPAAEMHDVSLVLAPYGHPGRAVGVVGVLGPTRMAYPHAICTVRYVTALMNELIDHLYA